MLIWALKWRVQCPARRGEVPTTLEALSLLPLRLTATSPTRGEEFKSIQHKMDYFNPLTDVADHVPTCFWYSFFFADVADHVPTTFDTRFADVQKLL